MMRSVNYAHSFHAQHVHYPSITGALQYARHFHCTFPLYDLVVYHSSLWHWACWVDGQRCDDAGQLDIKNGPFRP